MHTRGAFKAGQTVFGITAILVFVLTVVPLSLGQTPTAGNNDVYNSRPGGPVFRTPEMNQILGAPSLSRSLRQGGSPRQNSWSMRISTEEQ